MTLVSRRTLCLAALIATTLAAQAADAPVAPREQPSLLALSTAPSEAELHATIEKLISFGTRHTLSDTQSNTRGIGAARRWVKSRFEDMSKKCHGCLQIDLPEQTVNGERIPQPSAIVDVLAIQRGSGDPQRVIVISGHID